MTFLVANSSKGQMKIQQMAFVLVAIVIFFALVTIFYINIRLSSLKGDTEQLREDGARELVRKLSGSPELMWSATDCSSCIDLDKAFVLKDKEEYNEFWDIAFLQIEKIYPESENECSKENYPDCKTITLVDEGNYIAHTAFVAICRYESGEDYNKCELGRLSVGFKPVS